jgi:hypothetical protein
MWVIRNAQFNILAQQRLDDFHEKVLRRIREVSPDRAVADEQIKAHIDAGIALARDCGLRTESSVARFLEAAWVHYGSVAVRELPKQALPILYGHGVDPEIKVQRFIEWCQSGDNAANLWQTHSA